MLLQQIVLSVLLLVLLAAAMQLLDRWGRMVHRMELELVPGAISAGSVIVRRSESVQVVRGYQVQHRKRDDREGGEKQKQAPNDATFGPVESFHLDD